MLIQTVFDVSFSITSKQILVPIETIILSFLYPSFVTTRLPRKLKTEGGSVPVPSMMIRKKKNSGAGADYFSFRS